MAINRTSPKKGKVVDIPTAPTIGTATAGVESATVAFTASTKGGPVTTYTAISNPGSITGTGTSPITVSGLTGGTAYTFTVRGSNATGNGEYSSASNSVTAIASPASFYSIATVALTSGSQNTITFSSIPGTYKHLQLRGIQRKTGDATGNLLRFNGDSGSNYANHFIDGSGTTVSAYGEANVNRALIYTPGSGALANVFGAFIIDILDYADTNKFKTVRQINGYDLNGGGAITFFSNLWRSTSAITSISIESGVGDNAQYSHFALYGIKG